MTTTHKTASTYRELVERVQPPEEPDAPAPEQELDALVKTLQERECAAKGSTVPKQDPIHVLRELTINELVPVFVELVEKYSQAGISLQMDASNFLEGGRELRFEFGIDEHRIQLLGTVTTEAIAFHETRFSPDVQGELLSGPMLRLRGLNGEVFRSFICQRLSIMLRAVMRKR